MKEKELREIAECAICYKPFGHSGLPLFWRVRLQRYGVDMKAIQRQDGLAAFIGNTALAEAMGTNADIASVIDEVEVTICEPCAMEPQRLVMFLGDK